jgi:hypothetical protein
MGKTGIVIFHEFSTPATVPATAPATAPATPDGKREHYNRVYIGSYLMHL